MNKHVVTIRLEFESAKQCGEITGRFSDYINGLRYNGDPVASADLEVRTTPKHVIVEKLHWNGEQWIKE